MVLNMLPRRWGRTTPKNQYNQNSLVVLLENSARPPAPLTGMFFVEWKNSSQGQLKGILRAFGEGVKSARGQDCNTWPRRPHSKHVWNIPSHNLLQTNYCTRNSRNNAIALRPLWSFASHELLHELFWKKGERPPPPRQDSASGLY